MAPSSNLPPAESPDGEPETDPEATQLADRIVAELDLLGRNVEILQRLTSKTPLGIIRLSEAMRLPIHKVRYSLHLLEREGVIQPSASGAVVTDRSQEFWESLERSLDRMSETIQLLRERAAEHRAKAPGRKG